MTAACGRVNAGERKSQRVKERNLKLNKSSDEIHLKHRQLPDVILPANVKREPGAISSKVKSEHTKAGHSTEHPRVRCSVERPSAIVEPEGQYRNQHSISGSLKVDEDELDLERTLMGGQSFRWVKRIRYAPTGPNISFLGIVGDHMLELQRQDVETINYTKWNAEKPQTCAQVERLLRDYFQLQYKLTDLYDKWSKCDENFAKCSQYYKGFRILRQDPVENVFSFICATNNNIKRISQMVGNLCMTFGQPLSSSSDLVQPDGVGTDMQYYFPTVERLAQPDVIDICRNKLSFGYRANYIHETAKKLLARSSETKQSSKDYLLSLRQLPYKETCQKLQQFTGIGRKVADCICLMSMDHLDSVPVDCHIYQIVSRDYLTSLESDRKSLTPALHDLISVYFVKMFGPLAGWATSVLFVGELKHLKPSAGAKSQKRSAKNVAAKVLKKKMIKEE